MYEDNDKKIYVILSNNHENSILFNAACHLTAGIVDSVQGMSFHRYYNESSEFVANISHYPIVILKAKNSNQLKTLTEKCHQEKIQYNFFTTSMISHSAEQQKEDTLNAPVEELDFVAVALYGDRDILSPLTKKFSLFK
ncbi:DUF2000 domain-containing protein [Xenorhabdus sp. Vera]|uniref:DUF2000 domain-containing protein n=1 Tax=Xenorhabdus koppenhoeferi TaxID=351659 RepID=UPI00198E9F22|nr:DUF2000 domain-containing protein [Xenorhabdus sp. Vera]MBD2809610.1 DUF2000 domain-containing protein [Xenorhabdus sp. Vera]